MTEIYSGIVNRAGIEHYTGFPSVWCGDGVCGVRVNNDTRMPLPARKRTCRTCYRILSALHTDIGRLLEDAQIKLRRGPVE